MKIKVTEKHIKNGVQSDPDSCAVAQALQEAGFLHATAYFSPGLKLDRRDSQSFVVCPDHVKAWIKAFDRASDKTTIPPLEFDIDETAAKYMSLPL